MAALCIDGCLPASLIKPSASTDVKLSSIVYTVRDVCRLRAFTNPNARFADRPAVPSKR